MSQQTKIDGQSFAAQLLGQKGEPRDWAFTQLGHKRYVRDGRYLLHDGGQLYDIPNDLFEKNDLSKSTAPEIVSVKKQLQAVLDKNK